MQTDNISAKTIDLVKIYQKSRSEVKALDGVNFEVQKGEFVSIMGTSGSGKSTLLHLIGTLDKPTSGKVYVEGNDLSGLSDNALSDLRRERIGFIFQQFNLLPTLTALENAALPMLLAGKTSKKELEEVKEIFGSLGMSHRLEHKPEELSGGEMQRVAIARALVLKPVIILADEPTGNLDSKTSLEILNLLKKCHDDFNQTIIMVTHDQEAADTGDRILNLKDGRII